MAFAPLYNKTVIKKKFSDIEITTKQRKIANNWIDKIKNKELEKEVENYDVFKETILIELLGYPREEIKNKILSFGDNIDVIIRQKYIAFKTNYNFVYINMKRSMVHVDISIKVKEVEDPKHVIRNMKGIGHHGAGQSRITITEKSQIPYLIGLIEQSYSKSIKS